MKNNKQLRQSTFYIKGMHCASCEILIEKRLIKEDPIESVDVSLATNQITIEHQSNFTPTGKFLNKIFQNDGYRFSSTPFKSGRASVCPVSPKTPISFSSVSIALLFIFAFIFLNRSGFSSLVSVNSQSSLPLFFLFGLLAGFSSCAALVGGIILSLSKQWLSFYDSENSTLQKLEPHLLFNLGRVLGYGIFGALLGYVGNFFRLSPVFTATLVIAVSAIMVLLALQMLGIKAMARFQPRLPKFLTGKIADESNFQGRFAPALMGALTFFLPCGFTITAQALALASGTPLQGALIMALFALGTVPGLLAIGLSSVKFYRNPATAGQFSTIAGILVLFFALFNINNQLNVLGVSTPLTVGARSPNVSDANLPPITNNQQIIKMDASSSGYTPNYFKVRAGVPVRWEITDRGTSGCTNAVISRSLFTGQIDLVPGTTSVKEFTVDKPGVYRFSCWMGMISGTMEVVDSSGSTGTAAGAAPVGSGAKGCGCGGGGAGGSCGGR